MSENSKIEWTDHTFNPWWGCQKVSEGCKNCYAETLDNRWKGGHWGPGSDRKPMSESYWHQPLKWNAAAQKAAIRAKAFCASMADVFEDNPMVSIHRSRLFELIDKTPWLIWQLLTKRPENINRFIPLHWAFRFPKNVWIGTSVENQAAAEERIPHLLNVQGAIRFLSCEPLLGPVDFSSWTYPKDFIGMEVSNIEETESSTLQQDIHWVIAGGESGPHARPMHVEWARSLRDQCQSSGVSFFFKQWGEWVEDRQHGNFIPGKDVRSVKNILLDGSEYTTGIIRCGDLACMLKVGKKAAGRLLDGQEWNEFPITKTKGE